MRKILNNLWSQRTNNVWLFLELIVVCFVAWTQLDPIIVRLYYRSLPSGIDGERMGQHPVHATIRDSGRQYDAGGNQ